MSDQAAQMMARLMQERIVYVADPISDGVAQLVSLQLQALQQEPSRPASLYLRGKGGPVAAVLAIYEAMQAVTFPLHTVALGRVEGWSALLVAAGTKGQRCAAPAAHFVIGPPEVDGAGLDFQAYLQRVRSLCQTFHELLARHTGQSVETLSAISQPRQLSGQQAREFGLVDRLLS